MAKIIRIIIYEGDESWMQKQLSNSLPDGIKDLSCKRSIKDLSCKRSIKVITLGTLPDNLNLLDEKVDSHE